MLVSVGNRLGLWTLPLYFAGKCECGKCTCYPPGDRRVYGKTCECDDRRCEDLEGVVCGGEHPLYLCSSHAPGFMHPPFWFSSFFKNIYIQKKRHKKPWTLRTTLCNWVCHIQLSFYFLQLLLEGWENPLIPSIENCWD